jgi:Protein of unknown function (DUF3829)
MVSMVSIRALVAASATAALVAAAVLLGACKGGDSAGATESGPGGKARQRAMNGFVEGYNIIIEEMPRILEDYFGNTPEEGPTLESLDRGKGPLGSCGFNESYRTNIEKAFTAGRKHAGTELAYLADAADALWAASKAILEVHDEHCKYVRAEDFKDDKGAKAIELHKKWAAGLAAYRPALDKMREGLDEAEDAEAAGEIEEHAGDKSYSYWFRRFSVEAKNFVRNLRGDPAQVASHFAELEKVHGELMAFGQGKGAGLNQDYKSYQDQADRYYTHAKRLARNARDAKDAEARDKAIEREFEGLINNYNHLIEEHSRLEGREAEGGLK